MRCRTARRAIELEIDGLLPLDRGFELEAHLVECAPCRERARSLRRVDRALLELPDPPVAQLDVERSAARIRARLEAESKPSTRATTARPWVLLTWACAAAAAGALLWFAPAGDEPRASDPVEAEPLAVRDASEGEPSAPVHEPDPLDAIATAAAVPSADVADAIDPLRLERARAEVRALLTEAGAEFDPASRDARVEAFAERFDRASLPLRRAEWPVRRILERLLEDEDARTASLAARYLGVRGDTGSRTRLQQQLAREDLARVTTLALCDAGEDGIQGLVQALGLPAERELALATLATLDGTRVAPLLAATLVEEADAQDAIASSADLLGALAGLGPAGWDSLVQLCIEQHLPLAVLTERLAGEPGVAAWILASLDGRLRPDELELRLECAASLAPVELLPRLLAMLSERELRAVALRRLPLVPGSATVESLVAASEDPRLSSEELQALVQCALEKDSLRFARVAEELVRTEAVAAQTTLAELLVAAESPLALPAVAILCNSPKLRSELGQELVLTIGALGSERDARVLAELFERLGDDDRHLAACCVLAIEQLAGDEALRTVLAQQDERSTTNILRLLRTRKSETRPHPAIYKIARELRPFLSERRIETWRSSS